MRVSDRPPAIVTMIATTMASRGRSTKTDEIHERIYPAARPAGGRLERSRLKTGAGVTNGLLRGLWVCLGRLLGGRSGPTSCPARTFWMPSTITDCPSVRSAITPAIVVVDCPSLTGVLTALLSLPTT